ncbi:MAG: S8 family serine peptidase [Gammaproteobacteria bacterium]|nr:S8 family serine peptidase [Gammaproteobacteria bacterium]
MRYEIGIENTHTGKLTGNKKFIQICKEQEKRNIEASVSRQEGVSRQENSSGEDNYTPSSGSSRIAERSHIPETIDNEYEPRELIAISNDMVKGQMLEKVIQDLGYRIIRRKPVKHLGFVFTTIRLPEGTVLKEAIKKIEQKVDVRIDKNHRFRPAGNNSGKIYAHKLMKWNNQTGCGKGIRIGMIDTGVDENHPAFAKARIESKSFFPAGIKPASVRHGTAIASILIGDREFNGMLPNASLYSAQVFRELKNGHTDTTAEYIIYALDWLLGKQVLAINFSLAGAKNELLEYAIKKVANKKIFIAAAGGNNGANAQPVYPAAYKQVVAVTAVDANLDIYSKANQGDYIEVSAPGVDIWAARAGGQGAYYSGTSFATPFVTVTGALLRQRSTKEILGINTRDLGDEGRDSVYGLGLIQLNKLCKN